MVQIGLGEKITKSLKNEHHIPAHSFSEWRTMSVQLGIPTELNYNLLWHKKCHLTLNLKILLIAWRIKDRIQNLLLLRLMHLALFREETVLIK